MGNKRVLTSSGNVVDLDKSDDVQNLPPDSIVMGARTYGSGYAPNNFFIKMNGRTTLIRFGFGQFYDLDGARRLLMEAEQMKNHYKFPFELVQDQVSGDIYYILNIPSHGRNHRISIIYDRFHPDYEMQAIIHSPTLNMTRIGHHWYGPNRPCYTQKWDRSWTALKVATQLSFFLHDYYEGKYDIFKEWRF